MSQYIVGEATEAEIQKQLKRYEELEQCTHTLTN